MHRDLLERRHSSTADRHEPQRDQPSDRRPPLHATALHLQPAQAGSPPRRAEACAGRFARVHRRAPKGTRRFIIPERKWNWQVLCERQKLAHERKMQQDNERTRIMTRTGRTRGRRPDDANAARNDSKTRIFTAPCSSCSGTDGRWIRCARATYDPPGRPDHPRSFFVHLKSSGQTDGKAARDGNI